MSNEVTMSETEKQEHTTKALPHYVARAAADTHALRMKHLLSLALKASDGDEKDLPHIAWLGVEWKRVSEESREHGKRYSAELPKDRDSRFAVMAHVEEAARNG